MQVISTKSDIFTIRIRVPRYFFNATHIVLPSKKIQKRDIIRMVLASIYMLTVNMK